VELPLSIYLSSLRRAGFASVGRSRSGFGFQGRPKEIAAAKERGGYNLRYEEKLGPADIARRLGIGRASVYRVLGKKGAAQPCLSTRSCDLSIPRTGGS
jgi:DNA invertase Pin-like site-specific DNA recombinase